MRLFIAINLNDEMKDTLCRTEKELQEQGAEGNFSGRENLHLTLAFLGEVERKRVEAIKSAMDAVCFPAFELELGKPGRFKREEGDILWIGLQTSEMLKTVRSSLMGELKKRGFQPDDKPFKPHLTIGRRITGVSRMPELVKRPRQQVTSMELMLSERKNGKLIYTPIYSRVVDRAIP